MSPHLVMLVEAYEQERQAHAQITWLFLLEQISGNSRIERAQCSQPATKWLAGLLEE